jgi:hypothetical protein
MYKIVSYFAGSGRLAIIITTTIVCDSLSACSSNIIVENKSYNFLKLL